MSSHPQRLWQALLRVLRPGEDALAAYRERIAVHLSLLVALLLLPFTAAHLLNGRWMLALVVAGALVILGFNGVALHRGRAPPVPFGLMAVALGVAVCSAILLQGINAMPWAFPTLFILFFVLPRGQALGLAVLLLAGATVASGLTVGWPFATRVFATLALTLVMINVVLNVIGELQAALMAQAITDPLTGAYNRRHFDDQLAQLSPPLPGAGVATNVLLALDIDHFKDINDRHGHAVGDTVLKAVVELLNARKRPSDRLFRTGGEEFVLLLPRIAPADGVRLADELRTRIEHAPLLPGHAVTVSFGVAPQRASGDASAWLAGADEALYAAKRAGRNRVVLAVG